jgi:hypothetical protein
MFVAILAITAGSVFAQLTLDGYINTGLGLVITDRQEADGAETKSVDPYLTAFGVDSEQFGYRFQLNGTYTNEAKTTGAKFRIRSQGTNNSTFMHYASGWVTFLDMFTLNGGLIDDGTWNSGGAIFDADQGEGLGLLLKISPIAGLDLGFGAYALRGLPTSTYNKLNLDQARYTFNAAYTMPDVFKFVATFRPEAKDLPNATDSSKPASDESMRAIVAFHFRAVPGLTAIVEGEFDQLQKFSDIGKVNIFETIGYSFGDLGVGINAGEYITQEENKDMAIRVQPWVTYTLGNIVPRLDVVYFMGGGISTSDNSSEGAYHRKSYGVTSYNAKDTLLAIRPSVKFNVDGKTTIEIGDAINIENREVEFFGVPTELKKGKMTNIFYIDVKVSF